MTPSTYLLGSGGPATWFHEVEKDDRPDRPGEFRYLVDHTATAAIAMLTRAGWTVRVHRGPTAGCA